MLRPEPKSNVNEGLLQSFGIGLELLEVFGIERGVIPPEVAVFIDQHEAGAVDQAVPDSSNVEGVHGEQVDGGKRPGEQNPIRSGAAEAMGVGVEHLGSVVLRVDRD